MNDKAQNPEDNQETATPEGFDKPNGPFANRKTPSFAEETETPSEQVATEETSAPTADDSARVAELEAQLAEMKEQALRAMAETENMRKRTERERSDMQKYAITGFAKDLLNVSDNLRRAIEAVPEEQRERNEIIINLLTGVEATERELLKVFEQRGLQKIEPLEEKFDPNFHEVMFEAPSSDYPEGTIIQVIEAGYVLNDRLLRPARVGVSKGMPEAPKDGGEHHIDQEV
ncbi:MAG: nucleotide exchange factor GrpE [Bdellovibrionales bacterium]